MAEDERASVLVVGVGNEFRGDDGAGIEVARRLREGRADSIDVEEEQGDPTALIDRWRGRTAVVLVDAVEGPNAGAIHRLDASSRPLPSRLRTSSSTHAVALDETIELARTLGELPARVVVYALEGQRFEAGAALSEAVAAALPELAETVLAEAHELRSNQ